MHSLAEAATGGPWIFETVTALLQPLPVAAIALPVAAVALHVRNFGVEDSGLKGRLQGSGKQSNSFGPLQQD